METKRIKQEPNSNMCPLCGGETILQKHANFLLWCEIPDENIACRYCNKCGNVFIHTEKKGLNDSL